jgi:hypothetical protein
MLAAALKNMQTSFAEDGFVIAQGFFNADMVTEIRQRAEQVLAQRTRVSGNYTNVTKGLEKVDSFFAELMHNGPQVALMQQLLGMKPIPVTTSLFTKNNTTEQVNPHSDAKTGGVIWVALDDCNCDNGCMHFLRGSHLRQQEFAYLRPDRPNDLSDHPDKVAAIMKAGDMLLFRSTTVHWSGPNFDGSPRRGFNCFYTGKAG